MENIKTEIKISDILVEAKMFQFDYEIINLDTGSIFSKGKYQRVHEWAGKYESLRNALKNGMAMKLVLHDMAEDLDNMDWGEK